jgi:FlaA1/EpsC-like NDP-sugar epimerase
MVEIMVPAHVVRRTADGLTSLLNPVLNYRGRDALKIPLDLLLIVITALWVCFDALDHTGVSPKPLPFVAVVVVARLIIYIGLSLHRTSWRDVCRYDVLWLATSAALGPPLIGFIFFLLPDPFTLNALVRPHHVIVLEPTIYLMLLCGARITVRALATNRQPSDRKRVLIVGARAAARSLAFQIQESSLGYRVVGFVDDDERIQGHRIRGLRVLGKLADLGNVIEERMIDQVVLAIPSMTPDKLRWLMEICEPTGVPIRILPPLPELMNAKPDVAALREVRMEDLLPRPEVKLDRQAVSKYIKGKTVLVSGGGGSIGGELCRQVISAGAAKLLVLGRGENSVFEMVQELNESNSGVEVVPVICDVRDRAALARIFQKFSPNVVFHAAAHKHVPLMEMYPAEAIKNNVIGTQNIAELSAEFGSERFVLVSTDKAVNPKSVMGASKHIAEMVVSGCARTWGANMVSVRFGNVLGSRGSVVPVMTRQIKNRRPITVTDPEMVRYFMTIPEAVELILQAGAQGGRGEVFILDMGHPVRILDLARDLIRLSGLVPHKDIQIKITGRRPGEKLKEDFLTHVEIAGARKNGHFYTAPSKPVRIEEIYPRLERLRAAAEADDHALIVSLIKEIVPSFAPDFERMPDQAAVAPTATDTTRADVRMDEMVAPRVMKRKVSVA